MLNHFNDNSASPELLTQQRRATMRGEAPPDSIGVPDQPTVDTSLTVSPEIEFTTTAQLTTETYSDANEERLLTMVLVGISTAMTALTYVIAKQTDEPQALLSTGIIGASNLGMSSVHIFGRRIADSKLHMKLQQRAAERVHRKQWQSSRKSLESVDDPELAAALVRQLVSL